MRIHGKSYGLRQIACRFTTNLKNISICRFTFAVDFQPHLQPITKPIYGKSAANPRQIVRSVRHMYDKSHKVSTKKQQSTANIQLIRGKSTESLQLYDWSTTSRRQIYSKSHQWSLTVRCIIYWNTQYYGGRCTLTGPSSRIRHYTTAWSAQGTHTTLS